MTEDGHRNNWPMIYRNCLRHTDGHLWKDALHLPATSVLSRQWSVTSWVLRRSANQTHQKKNHDILCLPGALLWGQNPPNTHEHHSLEACLVKLTFALYKSLQVKNQQDSKSVEKQDQQHQCPKQRAHRAHNAQCQGPENAGNPFLSSFIFIHLLCTEQSGWRLSLPTSSHLPGMKLYQTRRRITYDGKIIHVRRA